MEDAFFMKTAVELAERGCGRVSPNPMVGAVIVKDGMIIGRGWHRQYGQSHAEVNSLADCGGDAQGATMYVTLEPCCYWGKTPPCTDAIIAAGIRRVVVGSTDPNPQVAGQGIAILRRHGIEVTAGVLKDECDKQNHVFFHYIQNKTPFVVMKYAMTADGKTATHTGASRWITGEPARLRVHEDRHRYTGIMAGVGTILADDPQLTCRLPGCRSPIRIICDTRLRTPLTAAVVLTARQNRTLLATSCTDRQRQQPYLEAGCELAVLPESPEGGVDLPYLMQMLGRRGIDSILLEGGGSLNWSALKSGIVHRVQTYIAPRLFGGGAQYTPVGGPGVDLPSDAFCLNFLSASLIGRDFLIESEVIPCSQES